MRRELGAALVCVLVLSGCARRILERNLTALKGRPHSAITERLGASNAILGEGVSHSGAAPQSRSCDCAAFPGIRRSDFPLRFTAFKRPREGRRSRGQDLHPIELID